MIRMKPTLLLFGWIASVANAQLLSANSENTQHMGQKATCPYNGGLVGVCTSGRDQNCGGKSHTAICNEHKFTFTNTPVVKSTGTFGDYLYCDGNQIATAICASRGLRDCENRKYSHQMWCTGFDSTRMEFGPPENVQGTKVCGHTTKWYVN